jgi:hypothetical protein
VKKAAHGRRNRHLALRAEFGLDSLHAMRLSLYRGNAPGHAP